MMSEQSLPLGTFFQHTQDNIETKIAAMISDEKILRLLKGGKRLRPLLATLSFKVCTSGKDTAQQYQKALEMAVGVELAHNASLVHDDIIDGDTKRRGELAYYIREGVDNAILVGHKMLAIGFNIALSHGGKFAKLYVDTWSRTLAGQLKEVNFNTKDINGNKGISKNSKFFAVYSDIIDLKTATLFSAACQGAAYEAHASENVAQILAEYGREIGLAYQLADDLVDLEKGEMIDSVILPLMNRLEKKSIKNGSMTARTLKKKLEENSLEIKQLYLEEIKKHMRRAQELSKSTVLPSNQYKTILQEAPAHIINTMLREINIAL